MSKNIHGYQRIPFNILVVLGWSVILNLCYCFPCQAQECDKVNCLKQQSESVSYGLAGGQAYRNAACLIQSASQGQSPTVLEQKFKDWLQPQFIFINIDNVRIHWNIKTLPEIWKSSGYSIPLQRHEKQAQTYENHIYFKTSQNGIEESKLLELLIHHLVHVQQFENIGNRADALCQFGASYFKAYFLQSKQSYDQNWMEKEANNKVKELLKSEVTIQNATGKPLVYDLYWSFEYFTSIVTNNQPLNNKKPQARSVEGIATPRISVRCRGCQSYSGNLTARYFLGKQPISPEKVYIFRLQGKKIVPE